MVPKHVAVIMDGNRRFSKRLMMKPWKGHEWGAKKLEQLLEWCREVRIEELTVYAFSVQNFARPKEEYDFLMKIFLESATKLKEKIISGDFKDLRMVFIGRLQLFPSDLQQAMHELMEMTKNNTGFRVNMAMAYGGREEVIDAVKKLGEKIKSGELSIDNLNEEVFENALYMDSEPDLIIRTGGERRTSNFLIWQSHYSEWYFVEKLWPEFEKQDFLEALASYSGRERRFGK